MSRRGVAVGAAIGVFFAFITPIAQTSLSAAVLIAVRANIPVAMVATLVKAPPTFGPLWEGTLFYSFGFPSPAYLLVNGVWLWRVRTHPRGTA